MSKETRVPVGLKSLQQFIVWRSEPRPPAKAAKVPYSPWDGRRASVTRPADWTGLDQALEALDGFDGVGFVFTAADPYCGVDLDGCRDPVSGSIATWAQDIISELDSYAEVSPSGGGVKVFLRGAVPGGGRRMGRVELYSERRYFVITGQHLAGTPTSINDRGAQLLGMLQRLDGGPTSPVSTTAAEQRLVPARVVGTGGGEQADVILRKALGTAATGRGRTWPYAGCCCTGRMAMQCSLMRCSGGRV